MIIPIQPQDFTLQNTSYWYFLGLLYFTSDIPNVRFCNFVMRPKGRTMIKRANNWKKSNTVSNKSKKKNHQSQRKTSSKIGIKSVYEYGQRKKQPVRTKLPTVSPLPQRSTDSILKVPVKMVNHYLSLLPSPHVSCLSHNQYSLSLLYSSLCRFWIAL